MKASPGLTRDAHDEPIRQHPGAAGDRGKIAARFAHHGRRFARNRTFIHRCHAFHDYAVRGDHVASLHQEEIAFAQIGAGVGGPFRRRASVSCSFLALMDCFKPRSEAACALLRPSASASAKLANSTVNHSHAAMAKMNRGRRFALAAQRLQKKNAGQNAADVHDEHHGIAQLHARR